MAGKLIDITGNKYNRLTVIGLSHISKHRSYWKCKCDCGNEIVLRKDMFIHLGKSNQYQSCGCLRVEYRQLMSDLLKKEICDIKKKLPTICSNILKKKQGE